MNEQMFIAPTIDFPKYDANSNNFLIVCAICGSRELDIGMSMKHSIPDPFERIGPACNGIFGPIDGF